MILKPKYVLDSHKLSINKAFKFWEFTSNEFLILYWWILGDTQILKIVCIGYHVSQHKSLILYLVISQSSDLTPHGFSAYFALCGWYHLTMNMPQADRCWRGPAVACVACFRRGHPSVSSEAAGKGKQWWHQRDGGWQGGWSWRTSSPSFKAQDDGVNVDTL